MPELPEVETIRRGLAPLLTGRRIKKVAVYNPNLRWKIPEHLSKSVVGSTVTGVTRRGKYLLLELSHGTLILHLGMSGSLGVKDHRAILEKHDHFDLLFDNQKILRLHDPRRFGAVLWTIDDPSNHPLLVDLGPEPFSRSFNAKRLYRDTRNKRVNIKQTLMDSHIVAGIGNIYASEALFRARIRPQTLAMRISLTRFEALVKAVRTTLRLAIKAGGSSLRDFVDSSGKPGYFQQQSLVYGRAGEECLRCGSPIKLIRQGQRASYYCSRCQT